MSNDVSKGPGDVESHKQGDSTVSVVEGGSKIPRRIAAETGVVDPASVRTPNLQIKTATSQESLKQASVSVRSSEGVAARQESLSPSMLPEEKSRDNAIPSNARPSAQMLNRISGQQKADTSYAKMDNGPATAITVLHPSRRPDSSDTVAVLPPVSRQAEVSNNPIVPIAPPADTGKSIGSDESLRPMNVPALLADQSDRLTHLEQTVKTIGLQREMEAFEAGKNSGVQHPENASMETLIAIVREQNVRIQELLEQVRILSEQRVMNDGTEPLSAPKRPSITPSSLYARALRYYRAGNFEQTISALRRALSSGIDRSLVDNCHFWIGVSLFQLRQTSAAFVEFGAVIADPQSEKRSSALLMVAQAYERSGRRDLAQRFYQRIVREYPGSNLKNLAEQKLSTRKSGPMF